MTGDDAILGEQSMQCELCDRPVEVPDRCELHSQTTDVEKLEEAMELITEVKEKHHKTDVPTMGMLLKARRNVRGARDRLEDADD